MNAELTRLMALAESGRHQEVEAWARPRAAEGDADAQFILGYLVFAGACVDFADSCEWFRRAAAQDHAEAIYELSRIDESRSHGPLKDADQRHDARAVAQGCGAGK
jgi:TPR repeat protein